MLRTIYFSPIGLVISFIQGFFGLFTRPFMIYGFFNRVTKRFIRTTRISSTAVVGNKKNLDIGENCWVWHHSVIDCSAPVKIGDGCQIGSWCGIFTHGSHISIRLHGAEYMKLPNTKRIGYLFLPVEIGEYTFIGSSALVMPGVTIGRGCIISAGAVVTTNIPDFSIASGNPARVIGKTLDLDKKYFDDLTVQKTYFDQEKIKEYLLGRDGN